MGKAILKSVFWGTSLKVQWVCAVLSCFSCVQLFATPRTVACQAPLSMGFSRQEYWIWLLYPSPGDLPSSGIEPTSLISPALAGGFFTTSTSWEVQWLRIHGSPLGGMGWILGWGTKIPSCHAEQPANNNNKKTAFKSTLYDWMVE